MLGFRPLGTGVLGGGALSAGPTNQVIEPTGIASLEAFGVAVIIGGASVDSSGCNINDARYAWFLSAVSP